MSVINFDSENLKVDWISFNLDGLVDPIIIAGRLSKYFTPHVLIDDVPKIGFHSFGKMYKVSIRQYTGSKGYWVGTKIIFSGKNASYFYKLIKMHNFDWNLLKFEERTLRLGRIDLCFSRPNDWSHTSKLFDAFLVDSRSQIQNHTNAKYIKLQDFPNGKMLKVNRRNKFVKFTGMQLSNHSDREKLLFYFSQLQKLDPIVKVFSNMAFRSYVCFPYVDCANPSGKSWVIEILSAEELFCFPYPFRLPKSFLRSGSKNDLRLKVRLMKSLTVNNQKKILDLEEFFNAINVRNDPLIQIKKNLIRLLNELVENKIIQNEVVIILKSRKNKDHLIQNLTTSDITRRIKYIQLHEIF